jgi:hypothetical protein
LGIFLPTHLVTLAAIAKKVLRLSFQHSFKWCNMTEEAGKNVGSIQQTIQNKYVGPIIMHFPKNYVIPTFRLG